MRAGAAGAGNMHTSCAAAFNPKVWTCATAPRKTVFSEFASCAGLPVPAPPFAQRGATIPDANPRAKFLRELWKSVPRLRPLGLDAPSIPCAADPGPAAHRESPGRVGVLQRRARRWHDRAARWRSSSRIVGRPAVRSCTGSHKTCRVTCDCRYSKSYSRSRTSVNWFPPKW